MNASATIQTAIADATPTRWGARLAFEPYNAAEVEAVAESVASATWPGAGAAARVGQRFDVEVTVDGEPQAWRVAPLATGCNVIAGRALLLA